MPRVASAQPVRKVYRIGILGLAPTTSNMAGPQPRNEYTAALLRGLRELGYAYGEHFVTEPRGAESRAERYPGFAVELVRLQVDVIVAVQATLSALKQATSTIPIVMAGSTDPVGQGYVQSLGHPGGNFTGLSFQDLELAEKRLELLKGLAESGRLRRQDLEGRQARRSARGAANQVRPGDQLENGEGAWPDHPAVDPAPRGTGHRVMWRASVAMIVGRSPSSLMTPSVSFSCQLTRVC